MKHREQERLAVGYNKLNMHCNHLHVNKYINTFIFVCDITCGLYKI